MGGKIPGRAHEAATRKFVGKLELITYTLNEAEQKEAALKVCEEVSGYLKAV